MFSYPQIARWLTFPIDPITVEDWVANRELFGQDKHDNSEQTEELEQAFQIEKLRAASVRQPADSGEPMENLDLFLLLNGVETAGIIDQKDYLVVAPSGRGTEGRKVAEIKAVYMGTKGEKISVIGGEIEVIDLDPTRSVKVQVSLGADLKIDRKSGVSWSGAGKRLLVVDVRGRPLPEFGLGVRQQELMKKMRKVL